MLRYKTNTSSETHAHFGVEKVRAGDILVHFLTQNNSIRNPFQHRINS